MISFDEALAIIVETARPLGAEEVPINCAAGRTLAADLHARVDAPPCDVSAMDGYAVREADLNILPARLQVLGESFAGSEEPGSLTAGTAMRIFTGAPVPSGADRVIIQEMVERDGDHAIIGEHPGPSRHIRPRGSDFKRGEVLLSAGTYLGFRQMVAAAGGDVSTLSAWRSPRVIILGTGDELVPPGTAAGRPGSIPESVSLGVATLAAEWGAIVENRIHLPDDLPLMMQAANRSLELADLVIVTGGASVGERDFAKAMFADHGLEILFSKVAIKPGKPVWLGRAGGRLVMGLPGNPTSALVTARLLLAPLLAGLSGRDTYATHHWRQVELLSPIEACGTRETFVRAQADDKGVIPISSQDSSGQKSLVQADVLIRRRAGATAIDSGELVTVLDF